MDCKQLPAATLELGTFIHTDIFQGILLKNSLYDLDSTKHV